MDWILIVGLGGLLLIIIIGALVVLASEYKH
jgi:hypothetical protein